MVNIAFITGINGQDGSYLSELLLSKGYIVYGIVRRTSCGNLDRIKHIASQLKLSIGDMMDMGSLVKILNRIVYENAMIEKFEIYNLAAQSNVDSSFAMPWYTNQVNNIGVFNLLNAIQVTNLTHKVRLYQAGTSEQFGEVQEIPQRETTPFNPVSPYAVSKLAAYWAIKEARKSLKIFACTGILFNHESPRRGLDFVTRKITYTLGQILKGQVNELVLGNMNSLRDWGHAKNYVKAMWLMLQQDEPDDFVIATGEQYTVRHFVEKCFSMVGYDLEWSGTGINEIGTDKKTGRVLVRISKDFFRPAEVETLLGDATKAKNSLNWTLDISFDQLVQEMVEHDCS